jgi:glycosyltransferase involved in cell wall biosynthesis
MHLLRFAAKVWPSARRAVLVHGTTPVEWPPVAPDVTIPLIQAAFATTHEATEMLRQELSCTVANVGNLFDASHYWRRSTEALISAWDPNGPITFLGTLTPNKTEPLHVLLQVLATTPYALTVVGDGPERPALEQVVSELGLSSRVHFAGTLADPRQAIQRSSVVVAGGRAAIEALAAGRPVVAATSDGLHGAITTENVESARRANYTGRSSVSTATTTPLLLDAIQTASSMSEFDRRALAAEHEQLGSVAPILQFLDT